MHEFVNSAFWGGLSPPLPPIFLIFLTCYLGLSVWKQSRRERCLWEHCTDSKILGLIVFQFMMQENQYNYKPRWTPSTGLENTSWEMNENKFCPKYSVGGYSGNLVGLHSTWERAWSNSRPLITWYLITLIIVVRWGGLLVLLNGRLELQRIFVELQLELQRI